MSEYIIATVSTSDLTREFLEEHNVPFISYTYTINNEVFEDDCREETRQAVYKRMRAGDDLLTSQINVYTYHDFFKKLMDTGKDVIFLDMSIPMSRSYISAGEAKEMIDKEYPNQRFYMMDTRCVSGGLGVLVKSMVRRHEEGMSFDDVIAWGEANKFHVMHHFTVDDLNYLKRGGRVSNASAMVGTLLSIKPVLYVPEDGTLIVSCKVRGRKAALLKILAQIKADLVEPDGQEVDILHADCLEDAEFMREKILQAFPTLKAVNITGLGVIIGAHCGPGLLTIFYFGDKRRP